MLRNDVTSSKAYLKLSAHAVKILIDIGQQYNGSNNGDFTACWTYMEKKGWGSRDTLTKKLKELIKAGLIEKTRKGGKNRCCLYAITWEAIDERKGKLDVKPTRTPSNKWKNTDTTTDKFNTISGTDG